MDVEATAISLELPGHKFKVISHDGHWNVITRTLRQSLQENGFEFTEIRRGTTILQTKTQPITFRIMTEDGLGLLIDGKAPTMGICLKDYPAFYLIGWDRWQKGNDGSMKDEATKDEATKDEATKDEVTRKESAQKGNH